MSPPEEPEVRLVRVGGGGSRTLRTWVVVAVIALVSVTIVGAGFLGGSAPTTPRPRAPSPPAAGQADGTPPAGASGSARPAPTSTVRPGRVIAPPNAGYEVDYARDGSHRPIV